VRKDKQPHKIRENYAARLEAWRTKQTQLADYTAKVARAQQRTLTDFFPEDEE
jgi:hypothetical protein